MLQTSNIRIKTNERDRQTDRDRDSDRQTDRQTDRQSSTTMASRPLVSIGEHVPPVTRDGFHLKNKQKND